MDRMTVRTVMSGILMDPFLDFMFPAAAVMAGLFFVPLEPFSVHS